LDLLTTITLEVVLSMHMHHSKRFCHFSNAFWKTIILPVVLYGCETWSLTLREEHSLRVFENKVVRRIFGPKTDAVTGMEKIA
jgi:hypothetical protein